MKRSEMNENQKLVFDIMREVMSEFIGGNECTLMDYSEEDEECIEAKRFLEQGHDSLKEFIRAETMSEATRMGYAKQAKFAGNEFLLERIERRLVKWGY